MSANPSIPAFFTPEYTNNWLQLVQQAEARLKEFVVMDTVNGKSKDFNQMGAVEWSSILGRASDTVITDTPLGKRRLTNGKFDIAALYDEFDEILLGQVALPRSETMMAHIMGWNRLSDRVIIAAALGSAQVPVVDLATDLETTTLVPLPSAQKVAIDFVETGSTTNSGLTIAKLRQAKFILDDGDVDPEEPRVIAYTAKELQQLLRTTEVTSTFYNTVQALVEGKVDTFLGFKFKLVSSRSVMPSAAGVRLLPCWVRSGIKVSSTGAMAHIDIRPDKRHALQIRHAGMQGGVRMEEAKVAQIAVDTTL